MRDTELLQSVALISFSSICPIVHCSPISSQSLIGCSRLMTLKSSPLKYHNKWLSSVFFFFFCTQRSAKCGQASVSKRRPWCWRAATFPPPSCRLPAKGWACWRTLPAPWRSWETRGPSTTASKWLSSWAAAPPSPTARENGQEGEGKGLRDMHRHCI